MYNFICLSNQHYDLPFKTNKHQVMDELNSRGHTIIFVDPPTRFDALKRLIKNRTLIHRKSSSFYVYSPLNLANFFPFSYLSNIIHFFVIRSLLNKVNTKNKSVLWAYHFDFPRIFDIKNLLKPSVFIYDVVDDYASFPEYEKRDIAYKKRNLVLYIIEYIDRFFKELIDQNGHKGKDWVNYRELELAKKVDLMYASHPYLYEKFKKLTKKIYYTPNAGAFELYSQKPSYEPEEFKKISRPIVGYSGALDAYKFDVDLFLYTAKKTPDINYILIGPLQLSDSTSSIQELKNLKNVYLIGIKSNQETAVYTHYFDSYIIPYQQNDYVQKGCFPIKFFNSLATGVPVVVTDLTAYKGFEDVLYIAKTKEDFVKRVAESVKDKSKENREKRILIASQNTWVHKVNKQLSAIENFLLSS